MGWRFQVGEGVPGPPPPRPQSPSHTPETPPRPPPLLTREEHRVEGHVVLAHKLDQLNALGVLPPLAPGLGGGRFWGGERNWFSGEGGAAGLGGGEGAMGGRDGGARSVLEGCGWVFVGDRVWWQQGPASRGRGRSERPPLPPHQWGV